MLSTISSPSACISLFRWSDEVVEFLGELSISSELSGAFELFFSDFIVTATICQITNGVNSLGKRCR